MKKLALVLSGALALLCFAGISALWSERLGESVLQFSNPGWRWLLQAYGATTVDDKLDLVFGLSLLVAAVAIGGLLVYGYRRWTRSKRSNGAFYIPLLALDATALLWLANALWWYARVPILTDAAHPLWVWLEQACGIERAYQLLAWAFPATSIAILFATISAAHYAINRRRRSPT
ncbi:hypothetical protein LJ656_18995 [Paraburkholderia sp. MMS20-SJTR3]|uniref:Uncharacterized protein n=1 Tax=Paraburkholderia sejongensis TaxID=2886946 RepID=A0ABS8JXQ4_9BURK|nr:hypothetical protein [Paraburkholderia sp. MMS20-SJTR3]MCC8394684.1 hypothetical protein [Paraburkholderia sp. MMS20-SJTR3]